jgi:glutathione S-transferase
MSDMKPIKVWGAGGPNPPKVAILLEELNIPHEIVSISFPDLKQPDYLKINPNGRMPAIEDPNTGLTLWESGAIIEYIIEKYDTAHKLSFAPGSNDAYLAKQWLFYQVSGQGPYYGQAVWFTKFHGEKVPSAVERYTNEINRVTSVLEGHLKEQKEKNAGGDGPWLVGGKMSYADLAFVPWQRLVPMLEGHKPEEYPLVKEWIGKMTERKALKSVFEKADH